MFYKIINEVGEWVEELMDRQHEHTIVFYFGRGQAHVI